MSIRKVCNGKTLSCWIAQLINICVDKHAGQFQQWKVNQLRTASGYKTISAISATKLYDKKFSAEAMETARREQKGAWDDIPPAFFAAPVSSKDLQCGNKY
jgi:hypothetical protein